MRGFIKHSSALGTLPLVRSSTLPTPTPCHIYPVYSLITPKPNSLNFSRCSDVYVAEARSRQLSTSSRLSQGPVSSEQETKHINDGAIISEKYNKDKEDFWKLPPGSWDTHFHIFDPSYPYSSSRAFTPPAAPRNSFEAFNASLTSTGRSSALVLVQPSVYGTDNSLTLNFLRSERKTGADREVRAIVVLDLDTVTDRELTNMYALGVRGVRFNMSSSGKHVQASDLRERLLMASERLEGIKALKNWFLQLFIPGNVWEGIEPTIKDLPFRVIADHQGGMKGKTDLSPGTTTATQPGFTSLMRLAKDKKVFVKISAGYRSSKLTEGGYDDLEELIKTFANEVPDQLLWGSDWPHTGSSKDRPTRGIDVIEPLRTVDNRAALRNLRRWMGEGAWKSMLVENPKRMFK